MRHRNNSRPLGNFENFYFDLRTKHKRELEHKAKRRRALGTALLVCFLVLLLLIKAYPSKPSPTPRITEVAAVTRSPFKPLVRKSKPVKIGIQIGHWKVREHPEITALHTRTGGEANGVSELEINLAVGNIIKKQLEPYGITVELLPATIPPKYKADLFISLHADSVNNPQRRGYKSAYFEPLRNDFDKLLQKHIDEAFLGNLQIPHDHTNISSDMHKYYAFNHQRFLHVISPSTPGLILEMGYISNFKDLIFLKDSKRPATAISKGIISYLYEQGYLAKKRTSIFR